MGGIRIAASTVSYRLIHACVIPRCIEACIPTRSIQSDGWASQLLTGVRLT